MYMKKVSFFAVVAILAITSSCTKTGSTGPVGPAGPAYTGAISGHVDLYDQYGVKVLNGSNVVQLQLNNGTAINPDNTGYYIFGGLTTGDYNMEASAAGYAATKTNNFQFLTDTLNRDIKLSAIPNFSPTTVSVYPTAAGTGDSLIINFTADSRARNCILFINNTSTVGSLPANYLLVYTKAIAINATKAQITIPSSDLADAGIAPGATVYCAAYGYVVTDGSVYEDLATGKNVYNAVSASPVTTTFVAP